MQGRRAVSGGRRLGNYGTGRGRSADDRTAFLRVASASVELDFFSQFAALWVYIAYLVTGLRDRSSSFAFAFAAIGVTAAVLALYAL